MRKFKDIIEYTEYLMTSTDSEKVIRLISSKKGYTSDVEPKLVVEPYKTKNGRTLGALEGLSREQQESGIYYPHGAYKSLSGEIVEATKVELTNGVEFNLEDEIDRKNWEFVKYCPYIVMYPEELVNNKRAMFYVELPMALEAEQKLSTFDVKFKAMDLINKTPSTDLRFVANMLSYSLGDYTDSVIKSWLFEMANASAHGAKRIISAIDTPDYALALLMLKAKERGIIYYSSDMYMFNENYLGKTEEMVKDFLKDPSNKAIVDEINREIKTGETKTGKKK